MPIPHTPATAPDATTPPAAEWPTQRLDRLVHTGLARLTGGLSPVSQALALADWAWHLALSPGRQFELAALAAQLAADTLRTTLGSLTLGPGAPQARAVRERCSSLRTEFAQLRGVAGLKVATQATALMPRDPSGKFRRVVARGTHH
jgi:hypothetical protein